jgi:hypothetical protein
MECPRSGETGQDGFIVSSSFALTPGTWILLLLKLPDQQIRAAIDESFVIGPTRKGYLWETIAVPELRTQASELAEHLACTLDANLVPDLATHLSHA